MAHYIFENYANKGLPPSLPRLRKLLPELLEIIPCIRIIVDGLDEYPETDQRQVFQELLGLVKSSGSQCRVLFSNRESELINKTLSAKPIIDLKDQHNDVNEDIKAYVHASDELESLRSKFGSSLIDTIEPLISKKADG